MIEFHCLSNDRQYYDKELIYLGVVLIGSFICLTLFFKEVIPATVFLNFFTYFTYEPQFALPFLLTLYPT